MQVRCYQAAGAWQLPCEVVAHARGTHVKIQCRLAKIPRVAGEKMRRGMGERTAPELCGSFQEIEFTISPLPLNALFCRIAACP